MAPEEWPIAVPPADPAVEPARGAGRDRLSTVIADFFLDPDLRLTEQERALMHAMLADFLGVIADEIRAGLPEQMAPANDEDPHQLVTRLAGAGILDDPRLIALLLRRADEERLGTAVRARSLAAPVLLQSLIGSSSDEVGAAAMGLILARGRRRDRLGQPRLEFNDAPAELAPALAHAVAAALRGRLGPALRGDSDRALAGAASGLVARHDEGQGSDALSAALVRALQQASGLDEPLLTAAAQEGDVALLAEALARRAGIESAPAWDYLIAGRGGRLELLLRMAGVSRECAARLLALLGDLVGIADPGAAIERFDALEDDAVARARDRLRLDGQYRAALEALGTRDGKRAH